MKTLVILAIATILTSGLQVYLFTWEIFNPIFYWGLPWGDMLTVWAISLPYCLVIGWFVGKEFNHLIN